MPSYTLNINGQNRRVEVPENMPLLWVLRDVAGLTGTKYSCGIAQCRACTVHVDGVALPSCQLNVADLAGKEITTIEGLDPKGEHPVQLAWIEEQVPQCGYCQSGQIMSAAGLLAQNPNPSDEEIDGAMWGNICRCGSYNSIRKAVHRAAKMVNKPPTDKKPPNPKGSKR